MQRTAHLLESRHRDRSLARQEEREARLMALVEIEDIEFGAPQPGKIQAFAVDAPRIGGRNVYDIEFAGWVLGSQQPVKELEFHHEGVIIRRTPLDQQRQDVARDFPDSPASETPGFRTSVSVV